MTPPPRRQSAPARVEGLSPQVPRYVTSYAETPLSGESRCSEWVPRSRSPHGSHRRGGADESDDDDDDVWTGA